MFIIFNNNNLLHNLTSASPPSLITWWIPTALYSSDPVALDSAVPSLTSHLVMLSLLPHPTMTMMLSLLPTGPSYWPTYWSHRSDVLLQLVMEMVTVATGSACLGWLVVKEEGATQEWSQYRHDQSRQNQRQFLRTEKVEDGEKIVSIKTC